jgi:hypothetical protein
MAPLLPFLLCLVVSLASADFNYEVGKRIEETLGSYFDKPKRALSFISRFREIDGFKHHLSARDRDEYLKLCFSIGQEYDLPIIYYGLENGLYLGIHEKVGWYREPGNSGYNVSSDLQKYSITCVNERGDQELCILAPEDPYIECIDDCALVPCQEGDKSKWCPNYAIKTTKKDEILGYIPRSDYCLNYKGQFAETPGTIIKPGNASMLGDCYYADETTQVRRNIASDYAYCGNDLCSTTYLGGYYSENYGAYLLKRIVQSSTLSLNLMLFTV